jgi:hypothetical protein
VSQEQTHSTAHGLQKNSNPQITRNRTHRIIYQSGRCELSEMETGNRRKFHHIEADHISSADDRFQCSDHLESGKSARFGRTGGGHQGRIQVPDLMISTECRSLLRYKAPLCIQHLADLSLKTLRSKRLVQKLYSWFQYPVMHNGLIGISRHVDHLHFRSHRV